MSIDKLFADVQQKGPVCVGLDSQESFLPAYLRQQNISTGEKLFAFNKAIIDQTKDIAGCYKVQIACYEALGIDGLLSFQNTVRYARNAGSIVISDIKRGDISSTAAQYAKGHFSGDFETDFITVNAYMGEDAVSPYYPYLEQGKGMFVLVKTSNPSGKEIQDLLSGDCSVYQHMAKLVQAWGEKFTGACGYSAIGAVVGCTYPEEFDAVRDLMKNAFLLIPGYGAQGGTGKDIAHFFRGGVRGVVNSSRGLITAHKNKSENDGFAVYVREAVLTMREDILQWL